MLTCHPWQGSVEERITEMVQQRQGGIGNPGAGSRQQVLKHALCSASEAGARRGTLVNNVFISACSMPLPATHWISHACDVVR